MDYAKCSTSMLHSNIYSKTHESWMIDIELLSLDKLYNKLTRKPITWVTSSTNCYFLSLIIVIRIPTEQQIMWSQHTQLAKMSIGLFMTTEDRYQQNMIEWGVMSTSLRYQTFRKQFCNMSIACCVEKTPRNFQFCSRLSPGRYYSKTFDSVKMPSILLFQ